MTSPTPMADVALAPPVNGTIEIAGPERFRLSELVARYLEGHRVMPARSSRIPRPVISAPGWTMVHSSRTTIPRLAQITFEQWFATSAQK